PQQNGVAECFNRTLQEGACTLLGRAGLPDSFWMTALRQVALVKNRVLATVGDKQFLGPTTCYAASTPPRPVAPRPVDPSLRARSVAPSLRVPGPSLLAYAARRPPARGPSTPSPAPGPIPSPRPAPSAPSPAPGPVPSPHPAPTSALSLAPGPVPSPRLAPSLAHAWPPRRSLAPARPRL
ncbi:unnamed protein product, partial [Closterium sp. NIES-54]